MSINRPGGRVNQSLITNQSLSGAAFWSRSDSDGRNSEFAGMDGQVLIEAATRGNCDTLGNALSHQMKHDPLPNQVQHRMADWLGSVAQCRGLVAHQFFPFQRQLQRRGRYPRGAWRHASAGLVSSFGAVLDVPSFTATSNFDSRGEFLGTFRCEFDEKLLTGPLLQNQPILRLSRSRLMPSLGRYPTESHPHSHVCCCCREMHGFATLHRRLNAYATPQGRFEMQHKTKPSSIFGAVAIGLVLFCIATAFCLFAFVSVTATVSGTASLPNGTTATINGPFSCSENTRMTEIEAGGHIFAFSPTTISIDGAPVGPLDATVTDVQIDVRYWSASLRINGNEVSKLR